MNTSPPRESAKIIPFPVRTRRTAADKASETLAFAAREVSPGVQPTVSDAWYHDVAIQEARRTLKR